MTTRVSAHNIRTVASLLAAYGFETLDIVDALYHVTTTPVRTEEPYETRWYTGDTVCTLTYNEQLDTFELTEETR